MSVNDPLIRKTLPPGVCDLAVGEAHVVRSALLETYDPEIFGSVGGVMDCDYQPPHGYQPLVDELERRTGKRCIVTAGAKQGLSAVFYAMKRMGMIGVTMRGPWWSQMPAAIQMSGLDGFKPWDRPASLMGHLLVSPNNPDGHITNFVECAILRSYCADKRVPLVHDAAYYSPVYVTTSDCSLPNLARTSIHSVSKAYGLSGLRVGWIATDDDVIYDHVCEYTEATTVGVALPSQVLLYHILREEAVHPQNHQRFIQHARRELRTAKEMMVKVDQDVLETAGSVDVPGMFGWYKKGPRFDAERAQIHVAPGSAFGDPSRVRINLAVGSNVLSKVVERLNSL